MIYRGSDNPRARRSPLTVRALRLTDARALRGGKKSMRRWARVWEPAPFFPDEATTTFEDEE